MNTRTLREQRKDIGPLSMRLQRKKLPVIAADYIRQARQKAHEASLASHKAAEAARQGQQLEAMAFAYEASELAAEARFLAWQAEFPETAA